MMTKTQSSIYHIDFSSLIEKYAPKLTNCGTYYRGCCPHPHHDDRNPSFKINNTPGEEYNGIWVCSCGTGMLPGLLMSITGLPFEDVMNEILSLTNEVPDRIEIIRRQLKSTDKTRDFDYKKIKLKNSPEYIDRYLMTERSYSAEDAARVRSEFEICVSDEAVWCKDWIIIPVHNANGDLMIGWIGQRWSDPAIDYKTRGKYNGMDTSGMLFNLHRAKSTRWIVVVESIWCAMKLWSWGIPAVATFGARCDTDQARQLEENFIDIYLAYDEDNAGKKATKKAKELLIPQRNVRIVPDLYVDPDKMKNRQEFMERLGKVLI